MYMELLKLFSNVFNQSTTTHFIIIIFTVTKSNDSFQTINFFFLYKFLSVDNSNIGHCGKYIIIYQL